MPADPTCPEVVYLTRGNIVLPDVSTTQHAAAEARARSELGQKFGITASGGSITKGK